MLQLHACGKAALLAAALPEFQCELDLTLVLTAVACISMSHTHGAVDDSAAGPANLSDSLAAMPGISVGTSEKSTHKAAGAQSTMINNIEGAHSYQHIQSDVDSVRRYLSAQLRPGHNHVTMLPCSAASLLMQNTRHLGLTARTASCLACNQQLVFNFVRSTTKTIDFDVPCIEFQHAFQRQCHG